MLDFILVEAIETSSLIGINLRLNLPIRSSLMILIELLVSIKALRATSFTLAGTIAFDKLIGFDGLQFARTEDNCFFL